jgi:predicted Rossmann fold flavoprotein
MGASPFGYKVAEQFGLKIWPTRAGLVPLTLHLEDKDKFAALSGIGVDSEVTHQQTNFRENILFTHRGLSGPAILQISSYWSAGGSIQINLLPDQDLFANLTRHKIQQPQKQLKTIFNDYFPQRLVHTFLNSSVADKKLAELSHRDLEEAARDFQAWLVKPNGTEGYRTAEVTLGGVDCDAISSKTMEALAVSGLYFIGEVLDVTGWLGGYNFQWAWASGWVAGQVV